MSTRPLTTARAETRTRNRAAFSPASHFALLGGRYDHHGYRLPAFLDAVFVAKNEPGNLYPTFRPAHGAALRALRRSPGSRVVWGGSTSTACSSRASSVAITVALASLAAYAFARLEFRGRDLLYYTPF